MHTQEPMVALKNISKSFPGVMALTDVSMEFHAGAVHSIMGENGAGKSTLMKILSGAQVPTSGTIEINSKEVHFSSPLHAQHSGIGMIYQELTVLENLDVGRNLLLGSEPVTRAGLIDWSKLYSTAKSILDEFGLALDVKSSLSSLGVGEQQMVEIARVASREPRIIVMDEPTSSLGREEEEVLFELIRNLKSRGVAIAYVSHRMDEVFDLSDTISVLRDGHLIYTRQITDVTRAGVIEAMVGRNVDEIGDMRRMSPSLDTKPALSVRDLSDSGQFNNVSFDVYPGEVLGVAGLVGSGRTQLFECIFGLRNPQTGTISVGSQDLTTSTTKSRMDAGIAYVPDDRKRLGLVLGQTLSFNLTLTTLQQISKFGYRIRRRIEDLYDNWQRKLAIRATSGKQTTDTLSGGNQQKVLLAKWLARDPSVMILNEPTRGVDVGAKVEVHKLIREIAESGVAVVVISSELPEITKLSDRIMVMWKGAVSGMLSGRHVSEQQVLSLAFGENITAGSDGDIDAD